MTWLTSLPAAVLVIGGLVLALLVAIGGRLGRVPWIFVDRSCRSVGCLIA
jgi:hypothetical protein